CIDVRSLTVAGNGKWPAPKATLPRVAGEGTGVGLCNSDSYAPTPEDEGNQPEGDHQDHSRLRSTQGSRRQVRRLVRAVDDRHRRSSELGDLDHAHRADTHVIGDFLAGRIEAQ